MTIGRSRFMVQGSGFRVRGSGFRVVVASPRSRAQVAAVLAFVISHTTFLAAQDDETGRCLKAAFKLQVTSQQSLGTPNP